MHFIEGSMPVMNLGLPSVNTNMTGLPVAAADFANASCSSGNANSRVLPGLSAYAFSPTHKIEVFTNYKKSLSQQTDALSS